MNTFREIFISEDAKGDKRVFKKLFMSPGMKALKKEARSASVLLNWEVIQLGSNMPKAIVTVINKDGGPSLKLEMGYDYSDQKANFNVTCTGLDKKSKCSTLSQTIGNISDPEQASIAFEKILASKIYDFAKIFQDIKMVAIKKDFKNFGA